MTLPSFSLDGGKRVDDINIFQIKFQSVSHIIEITKGYPEHFESIIFKVLNEENLFPLLIQTRENLLKLADYFPLHGGAIVKALLDTPTYILQLVINKSDLEAIIKAFPDHKNVIMDNYDASINNALNDPSVFFECFKQIESLITAAEVYPKYAEAIFNKLISKKVVFQRIIPSTSDLILFISFFSDYTESIIDYILRLPAELSRLISSKPALDTILEIFPGYKQILTEAFENTRVKRVPKLDFSSRFFVSHEENQSTIRLEFQEQMEEAKKRSIDTLQKEIIDAYKKSDNTLSENEFWELSDEDTYSEGKFSEESEKGLIL
ncbi:hypothetical protein ACD661_16375 [Legionella lytica]|uniref:Flagellar motor switch protein FliG C-terminal domain-containing protein n=1 Tax=Legionella lytica TaxID=96232 RepID=A0ABW8DFV9_9GAMM